MKIQIHRRDDGHILVCALCTIVIVSLIGANVLVNCITHYNVTAKQLKGWKEALYAAEAGGDAGFDEVRKALNPLSLPFTTDGWAAAPSPAPTPGPAWTKTISGLGQEGNLSTTVTIDQLSAVAIDSDVVITWKYKGATLLEATNVSGPYTPVDGAPTSPFTNSTPDAIKFYRYSHDVNLIVANPYDM